MGAYLLLLIVGFLYPSCMTYLIVGISFKWLVQIAVNAKLMHILKEKDLLWKTPILDIATFVYYVVMTPLLIVKNRSNWS